MDRPSPSRGDSAPRPRCKRAKVLNYELVAALWMVSLLGIFTRVIRASEPVSFRMPEYATAAALPPPRTQREVDALLADAGPLDPPLSPLRVLLVAGPKDHGPGEHDYPAWQQTWSRLLAESPQTAVASAWEFPTAEEFANSDVVVFYQRGNWDAHRAAEIDKFLAGGGGLVYIHWAVDGRGAQADFAQRIGLAALGGSIRYRHGPLEIDFSPGKDHPIGRGLDKVRWVDESYWKLTGDAQRITLLGTGIEEGAAHPLFWVIEHGPGRVFVSIPGHYMWTFDDPIFRIVLLRGIAWSGGCDVDRFNALATLDARVEATPPTSPAQTTPSR